MGLKTHLPRRDHETRATLAKLWWNLGGTFRRTFNSTRICPREPQPQRVRKQFCSARERNHWSRKLLLLGEFTEKSSGRDKDYNNTPLTCCSTSMGCPKMVHSVMWRPPLNNVHCSHPQPLLPLLVPDASCQDSNGLSWCFRGAHETHIAITIFPVERLLFAHPGVLAVLLRASLWDKFIDGSLRHPMESHDYLPIPLPLFRPRASTVRTSSLQFAMRGLIFISAIFGDKARPVSGWCCNA